MGRLKDGAIKTKEFFNKENLQENKEQIEILAEKGAELTQETVMKTLDWAYESILTGFPGQKNVFEHCDDYIKRYQTEEAIRRLINSQTQKAATTGFLSNVGGLITLPVAIPVNLASVIFIQMRMIAAIAYLRGYDLKSDQVQTFIYITLAGTSVSELVKQAGIQMGNKTLAALVKKIPGSIILKINQTVGYRMVTKAGSTGTINILKMVPVVGGVVGGTFDTITTRSIAKLARHNFKDDGFDLGDGNVIKKEDLLNEN